MKQNKKKKLTKREIEVKKLLLVGFSNTKIASKLYITQSTAKRHISSIYRKEGVNTRFELFVKNFKDIITGMNKNQ
ncbi:MAG: helix-turn-helix transcriptional regulator [Candidatus Gastranaerophilales bacterium]|nr:helix-turn-helix transcriptional regulator [Candidatus Gastranaerophilales bacterium]